MKNLSLKVLWLDNAIAFSLDQSLHNKFIPLTGFYFWPQKDAWELIKFFLEDLNWISQEDAVSILNKITEIINFWQNRSDLARVTGTDLKVLFPGVYFIGFD